MTRSQVQQWFPDTYAFFAQAGDEHPFWQAMERIAIEHVSETNSLLPDLEQVFSSMHLIGGSDRVKQHLVEVKTHAELMRILTKLYVAYLYRNHGVQLLQDNHGYDIELEIADQLLALGIVDFHNFDSPELQFAAQIEHELAYLAQMKKQQSSDVLPKASIEHTPHQVETSSNQENDEENTEALLDSLKQHAPHYTQHPKAHHHILAVITHHSTLPREVALTKRIKESKDEMKKYFPHLSGVLLIDPETGKEKTTFIPFHGDDASDLEMLLNRIV